MWVPLPLALLLLFTGTTAQLDSQERLPVTVGVYGWNKPHFWTDAGGGNYTGFVAEVLDWVCDRGSLECSEVPIDSLDDMIPSVKNGTVDFIVGTLSMTPARARQVDFVHPAFYSGGAALFVAPGLEEAAAAMGWDGLRGQKLCMVSSYYAADGLVSEYGIVPVKLARQAQAAAAVQAGDCFAFVGDAGTMGLDLTEVAGLAPVMTAPYTIPIAKNATRLRRRLSAALVEAMQDGNQSPVLEWEKDHLTDAGLQPNAELQAVVSAISYFE